MGVCSGWRDRYSAEVEKSIQAANSFNENSQWHTRQMTDKEFQEVFDDKRESIHRLRVKKDGT